MKTITLKTKPISVNKMYRGRRFMSKEGKETKEAMGWEIKKQWKGEIIKDEVAINIIFYVPNKRSDLDNLLKGTLDCLTGIIYEDDSQITELHVFKENDKENPRIVLSVV